MRSQWLRRRWGRTRAVTRQSTEQWIRGSQRSKSCSRIKGYFTTWTRLGLCPLITTSVLNGRDEVIEQRLGVFQVDGVEALGEPARRGRSETQMSITPLRGQVPRRVACARGRLNLNYSSILQSHIRGCVDPDLGQNFLVVFAERRRAGPNARRGARKFRYRSGQRNRRAILA
jgi:hypothetical protein